MTAFIVIANVLLGLALVFGTSESIEPRLSRVWRFLSIDDDRSVL
jgi:hypothetical protein